MSKQPKEFNWARMQPYLLYRWGKYAAWLILRILFRIRVVGRENVPKSAKGVILVSNHIHSIDPPFLVTATMLPWRFIGKAELFQKNPGKWFYTHTGGFPVDRDIIDRKALDFAVRVIEDGSCGLAIFPEGGRSPDGTPQEAKTGMAMLARRTKADILPCSIYHEGKLGFRTRYTVRIGALIPFAQLGLGDTPNKRQSREACEKIMAAVRALWEKGSA